MVGIIFRKQQNTEFMKIVFIVHSYTENMGYAANCLPVALANLGHEVHIVSSQGKIYFYQPIYKQSYESFAGPPLDPIGVKKIGENLYLHRLGFKLIINTIFLKGLYRKLKEIKPDIVQVFEVASPYTAQAVLYKSLLKYKFYTANHTVLSVFPLHYSWNKWSLKKIKWKLLKQFPGIIISKFTEKCFPATIDAELIAIQYMGVPKEKCIMIPLGVETDRFHPPISEEESEHRKKIRSQLGFNDKDIVCIYTGRFATDKNPLIMAQAIHKLTKEGHSNYKGLFIGNGVQKDKIEECENCTIIAFIPYHELAPYYQTADIGVWPTQESTSMLDAAASALPIIVSNRVKAIERFEGNGLTYEELSVDDLAKKLLELEDAEQRIKLGQFGNKKIYENYSWEALAKLRAIHYDYSSS